MAITTPANKSYNCANKIFEITSDYPIAIMINGNVDFQEILLETLIGEFSKTVDFKNLKSIENIKSGFIEYLSTHTTYTSTDDYLSWILKSFKRQIIEEIEEYGFDETLNYYSKNEIKSYLKAYRNFSDEFFDIIPENKDKAKYNQILWKMFSHHLSFEGTGVIIAGFNADEFYPTFFEINLHCNDNGKIIYDEVDLRVNSKEPIIKVFAINEEAYAFITGVSYDFNEYIEDYIKKSDEKFLKQLKEKMIQEDFSTENIHQMQTICKILIENYNSNIIKMIQYYRLNAIDETSELTEFLPKTILWDLSDHLIKLTALKQKLSYENETVSSETQIAFISKTNNFKWIKKENEKFKY